MIKKVINDGLTGQQKVPFVDQILVLTEMHVFVLTYT